jgi:uncharacterized protein YutE (UPF0331/DUF86 family)
MVDIALLNRLLLSLDSYYQDLGSVQEMRLETFSTDIRSQRFVERTLHIAIECCLDICHHIISDQKWREPSSYADAFTVLAEHGVLPADTLAQYRLMAQFRNRLVHYYEKVESDQVFVIAKTRRDDFTAFAAAVRLWLSRPEISG